MKVPPAPWIATKPNKHGAVHIRTSETPPGAVAEVLQFDSRYSAVDTAKLIAAAPQVREVVAAIAARVNGMTAEALANRNRGPDEGASENGCTWWSGYYEACRDIQGLFADFP